MLLSLYKLKSVKEKFTFYVLGNHDKMLRDVILNLYLIFSDGIQAKQKFQPQRLKLEKEKNREMLCLISCLLGDSCENTFTELL